MKRRRFQVIDTSCQNFGPLTEPRVHETHVGGGVWRIKWSPEPARSAMVWTGRGHKVQRPLHLSARLLFTTTLDKRFEFWTSPCALLQWRRWGCAFDQLRFFCAGVHLPGLGMLVVVSTKRQLKGAEELAF